VQEVSANRERKIAALERAQHGLVSVPQLRDLGLSQSAISRRVARARNLRVRRAVLANPGVAPAFEQKVLAAVLAGGEGAFASHAAAAQLWGLPLPGAVPVEITTALERHPRLPGVRCHRSGLIADGDVATVHGIPVSSPARTIVDISSRFDTRVLGRVLDDALRRGLTTLAEVALTTERLGPAPGRSRKKMAALLARRDDGVARRESVLEDFVFEALVRFGLPLPLMQYPFAMNGRNRRIDFCYAPEMLVLEPKGFMWHSSRRAFDDDALRGNELQLAGFRVLEFTAAFTDWQIASQVARALALPVPKRPSRQLTFLEWCAARDRASSRRRAGTAQRLDNCAAKAARNCPNGGGG
jgi:hypothetical protein